MREQLARTFGLAADGPLPLVQVAEQLSHLLAEGATGLLLDFDGTLAPIVDLPERAQCPPNVQEAITRLAARLTTVAIVSGRDLSDLSQRVPVPGVWLVGSHGAVIRRPDGQENRAAVSGALAARLADLSIEQADLAGVRVERKGTAIAYHYRGREHDTALVSTLRDRVTAAAEANGLIVGEGRCVVEARVPGIDKGAALDRIVEETGLRRVVVAGDDWTDLDAIRAAHRHPTVQGIAVAVSSPEMPPPLCAEADVLATDVAELGQWLIGLAGDKPLPK